MKIDVYGLKNCDTCRNALKSLRETDFEVSFFDVRKDGLPLETLKMALAELGSDRLLNTRSATWRGLTASARLAPPLELLIEHPTLMKRPLLVANAHFLIGWDVQSTERLEAIENAA